MYERTLVAVCSGVSQEVALASVLVLYPIERVILVPLFTAVTVNIYSITFKQRNDQS